MYLQTGFLKQDYRDVEFKACYSKTGTRDSAGLSEADGTF